MTYILHIDTATDRGTVAVSADGIILASRTNEETRNHAGTINLLINDVLSDINISLPDISAVAVCGGPGSYTGLRIGVATAKGLCYALGKPLMLHNRLVLVAYNAFINKKKSASCFITLLLARDKEYFICIHDEDFNCTVSPQHIMEIQLNEFIEKKADTFLITDVSADIINPLDIINLQIDPNTNTTLNSWGIYAFDNYKSNNIVNLSAAEPFYLKQVYTHK